VKRRKLTDVELSRILSEPCPICAALNVRDYGEWETTCHRWDDPSLVILSDPDDALWLLSEAGLV